MPTWKVEDKGFMQNIKRHRLVGLPFYAAVDEHPIYGGFSFTAFGYGSTSKATSLEQAKAHLILKLKRNLRAALKTLEDD